MVTSKITEEYPVMALCSVHRFLLLAPSGWRVEKRFGSKRGEARRRRRRRRRRTTERERERKREAWMEKSCKEAEREREKGRGRRAEGY